MQSITSITNAASRAIWGEQGDPNAIDATTPRTTETGTGEGLSATTEGERKSEEYTTASGVEPVSGKMGDTKKGEPYDMGNSEPKTETPTTTGESGTPLAIRPADGNKTTTTTETPSTADAAIPQTTDAPGNTPSTAPIRSEHETDKTGVTSAHNPTSGFSSDKPTSSNDTSASGPTPSVGAAPIGDKQTPLTGSHSTHGAGELRNTQNTEETKAIRDTKDAAEDVQSKDTNAKGSGSTDLSDLGGKGTPGGMPDSIKKGLEAKSTGEGTGEQWVKSSGVKSEGGDFDATKPGAGREADRLLEQKGIHRETPATASKSSETKETSPSGEKEKMSLGDKIKAKLHKHKD